MAKTLLTLALMLGLTAAAVAESALYPLKWRVPPVPQPGTRQHDAVAAAYALRNPNKEPRLPDEWALVKEVYGRDLSEKQPKRMVVLEYDAAQEPEGRTAAVQKVVDILEPGDVVVTTQTNGQTSVALYVGDVYGHRRSHVLYVNKFGLVTETGCGTALFDHGEYKWRLRGAAKFTVLRPLVDPSVHIAKKRRFPKGIGLETSDENLKAILAVAWARYLKADAIQYDSSPVTSTKVRRNARGRWSRADRRGIVEEATADRTRYTVCSSFVYDAYYETFGYGIGDEGKHGYLSFELTCNPPEDILVYSYEKCTSGKTQAQVEEEIRATLRPGDAIAYSFRRSIGHVMLYIGEVDGIPTILHSTGGKYDFEAGYDETEYEGTMTKDDVEGLLLTPGSKRYLPKSHELVIVRPLQHAGLTLTSAGAARAKHPRFRYDRRAKGGTYGSVVSGETLIYGVELHNADCAPCDATVVESVPEGTELTAVSKGCKADGRRLTWPIELAPGERRIVSWKVKVTAKPGERIVAEGGSAGGIPSNRLETEVVGRHVTAEEAFAWAERNLGTVGNLPECRVRGWGGGYESEDPPGEERVLETRARDLMEGDVVASLHRKAGATRYRIWAKAKGGLVERAADGTFRAVSDPEVRALMADDFFAAFRPAAEGNAASDL